MADSSNTTLQAQGMMPSLTVDNLQQSLDFFAGLGFEVEDRWEDNGVLLGAMLKAGNARLGLSQDDGKKGRDRKKGVGIRARAFEVTEPSGFLLTIASPSPK